MLILTIQTTIRANKRREFLQTLLPLRKECQKEPGCLSYHTLQDIEHENTFYLIARWQGRETLEHYFQTRNFDVLLGALHILGESSEVMVNEISHPTGIETIQAFRHKGMTPKDIPSVCVATKNDLQWFPQH